MFPAVALTSLLSLFPLDEKKKKTRNNELFINNLIKQVDLNLSICKSV